MIRVNSPPAPDKDAVTIRMKRLGTSIRELRGEFSQSQLGDILTDEFGHPVQQTTISRWELGMTPVTAEQVYMIEEALGARPGTLFISSGYVDLDESAHSVEWTLRTDPNLHPDLRPVVVSTYRNYVETSRRLPKG